MSGASVDSILSSDEVEALLTAVDRGEIGQVNGRRRGGTVSVYDFRRPNRVSKDQVRMLYSIHEAFARLYTASLTSLLRGLVEVEVKTVEQLTYGEFVTSLTTPTCVVIFNMEPLKGGAALQIDAHILFRFIDRLLGGSGVLPVRLREFTEVEQVLIERVAVRAMMELQQAWQHAGTFGFRVAHLETNPQFVQLTAPSEVVVVVTFDVRMGEESGEMVLVFPHLMLEPVMPKLGSHRYFSTTQRPPTSQEAEELHRNVMRLGLELRGVLAEAPITVRDLLELKPGSVLGLGKPATTPATVELQGVPRFTGRAGTLNRRRAVRLLTVIPKGEMLRDAGDRPGSARVHAQ